ncbi:MAG TPA: hypothetical protein VHY22_13275, partial [Chthoniobacteraceae bacterium]|nr:hypothetical protein [Chthoniobacteraceae bacterium]
MKGRFAFVLLAGMLVALVAVSNDSLWIDELGTAVISMPSTLHGWWQAIYTVHNSNLQLPLYMLYIWAWVRMAGISALALRDANIPWFLLGLWAIYHFLKRHPRLRFFTVLLYCVHPFVWYYLSEVRPYTMQLGGELLAYGAFFQALDEPEKPLTASWWWLFLAGIFLLCAVGLLGVPWAAAVCLCMLMRRDFLSSAFRSGLPAVLVVAPALLALAVYYAWTLQTDARPTISNMRLTSILFVFYEQLGFVGLGPGRLEIRSSGVRVFLPFIPALCGLGLPLAYAIACGAAEGFGIPKSKRIAIFLAVLIPCAAIFALGYLKHFLVLGRHLMPMFPFLLLAVAFALHRLWDGGRLINRVVVVLVFAGLTASAMECRFAYRHRRDDYCDAAAIVKSALAHGERVWWAGDFGATVYYHLPLSYTLQGGNL